MLCELCKSRTIKSKKNVLITGEYNIAVTVEAVTCTKCEHQIIEPKEQMKMIKTYNNRIKKIKKIKEVQEIEREKNGCV